MSFTIPLKNQVLAANIGAVPREAEGNQKSLTPFDNSESKQSILSTEGNKMAFNLNLPSTTMRERTASRQAMIDAARTDGRHQTTQEFAQTTDRDATRAARDQQRIAGIQRQSTLYENVLHGQQSNMSALNISGAGNSGFQKYTVLTDVREIDSRQNSAETKVVPLINKYQKKKRDMSLVQSIESMTVMRPTLARSGQNLSKLSHAGPEYAKAIKPLKSSFHSMSHSVIQHVLERKYPAIQEAKQEARQSALNNDPSLNLLSLEMQESHHLQHQMSSQDHPTVVTVQVSQRTNEAGQQSNDEIAPIIQSHDEPLNTDE